jgi:hypothetical protein
MESLLTGGHLMNEELLHEYFFADDISDEAKEACSELVLFAFTESRFNEEKYEVDRVKHDCIDTDFLIQACDEWKRELYELSLKMLNESKML